MFIPLIAASAAKVARAGGHVCIGSHGEMQGIGYHWEMWALASGGWQPLEVLRAATLHGAEAIGYAQDLGSIETGKLADLVVLSADPLEDIHNTSSDPLRDEKRRAVRGRYARPDLAGQEAAAAALVVGGEAGEVKTVAAARYRRPTCGIEGCAFGPGESSVRAR